MFAYFVTKFFNYLFLLHFSSIRSRLPSDSSSLPKMKLCPPLNFFPSSSSSEHSDHPSYDKGSKSKYQDSKKQVLPSSSPPPCYTLFESHLGSSSTFSAIKSISRGLKREQEELKSLTIHNRAQTFEKEQIQSVGCVKTWTEVNLDESILKYQAVDDSLAENISHSTITQYPSLSTLSHHRKSSSCCKSDISKAQVRCPEKPIDRELSSSRVLTEDHLMPEKKKKTQASVFTFTCPVPDPEAFKITQHSAAEMEKEASPDGHNSKLSTYLSCSFTDCSTITNDNWKNSSGIRTGNKPISSSLQNEEEKEGTRACSRKSDMFVFSVNPNCISPLPLLENKAESDQSNFSIKLSESLKANFVSQPERISTLQPNTILEYLSLPGFVEMSVDEPVDECRVDESTSDCTKQTDGTLLRGEPDVVSKNWESQDHYYLKESNDNQSRYLVDLNIPAFPVGNSIPDNVTRSKPCLKLAQGNTSKNPGSSVTTCVSTQYFTYKGRCSQPLFSHKSFGSDKPTHFIPSQPLMSPKVVFNIPYQGDRMEGSLSEHTRWFQPQPGGTYPQYTSACIPQAPMPFMKKSFSVGPCRTLSGMGQPPPLLRKPISLETQKLEHHQSSRTYASCSCHKDDLFHLSVKYKTSSDCTSSDSYLRSGSSQQGTGHAKTYSSYDLERSCYSERPYMTPVYPLHAHGLSVQGPLKPYRHYRQESDPRRQATVFPESLKCPLSYQEALRLEQHRYVPQGPSQPLIAPRMVARWDHSHPIDSKKSFLRPFLKRAYRWPSQHQAALSSGVVQREIYGVSKCKSTDSTGVGGRASYASQSSGKGSVGPFGHIHQSLSITPTLLGSPETTEESDRLKRKSNLQEHNSKR